MLIEACPKIHIKTYRSVMVPNMFLNSTLNHWNLCLHYHIQCATFTKKILICFIQAPAVCLTIFLYVLCGVFPSAGGASWKMTGMSAWRIAHSHAFATSRPMPLLGCTILGEGGVCGRTWGLLVETEGRVLGSSPTK